MANDVTPEEAEQFNDDVQCVIERLKEFHVVGSEPYPDRPVVLASAAIVNQLFLRWFGIEASLANMEQIRDLRRVIQVWRAVRDSVPPTA